MMKAIQLSKAKTLSGIVPRGWMVVEIDVLGFMASGLIPIVFSILEGWQSGLLRQS